MAGKKYITPTTFIWKEVNLLLLAKIATLFEKALTVVIESNSDFKIKPPNEPCYFVGQVYDKGDLYPYLS
jgi:hypothetical protein